MLYFGALIASTTLMAKNMKKYLYDRSNTHTSHKTLNKNLQEPNWRFVSFWKIKSLTFTCSHSLSLSVPRVVIRCHSLYHSLSLVISQHSLSFDVTCCHSFSLIVIRYHSLYHLLSPVLIYLLYHSLLLVVTRWRSLSLVSFAAIRCHSMYNSSVFLTKKGKKIIQIKLIELNNITFLMRNFNGKNVQDIQAVYIRVRLSYFISKTLRLSPFWQASYFFLMHCNKIRITKQSFKQYQW